MSEASSRSRTLRQRIGFGGLMLAVVGGLAWLDYERGSTIGSKTAIFFLVAAGLAEYVRMVRGAGLEVEAPVTIVGGALLFAGHAFHLFSGLLLLPVYLVVLWCAVSALRRAKVREYLESTALTLFGVFWIGGLSCFLVDVLDHGVPMLLWLILVTKSCDIGAFFTGFFFGKHKLIPKVSPGKTVEGALGGLALSMIVSFALDRAFSLGWGVAWALLLGVVLGIVSMIGDLAESLVKRRLEAKDSAALIPAFGGVLDLIDSPLFTAPIAAACLEWIVR
ncbi:MAG: phosphatidate cytidylyltransferase [Planctomycetota bacterium]